MARKLQKSDAEIYQWFMHLEHCRVNDISYTAYARRHNMDSSEFRNYNFRIYWFKYTNPEFFYEMLHYATIYKSNASIKRDLIEFIKKYDLEYKYISQACTYLTYEDVLKREMISRGIDPNLHFDESYFNPELFFSDETNMEEFKKMTTNSIKISDPEVYYWYEHIEAQAKSVLSIAEYCKKNKFDHAVFRNFDYRINWKKKREPAYYKKMVFMVKKFKLLRHQNISEFCVENNLIKIHFDQARAHLSYLQAVERELVKRGMDISKLYPDDPTPEEMLIEGNVTRRANGPKVKKYEKKETKPLLKAKKLYKNRIMRPIVEEEEEDLMESENEEVIIEEPKKIISVHTNEHSVDKLVKIEATNDIEFSLGMGVRVMVSPTVDSMKIMKIIDMLKAL